MAAWLIFAVVVMLSLRYFAAITKHRAWPVVIAALAVIYLAADTGVWGSGRSTDEGGRHGVEDHSVPAPPAPNMVAQLDDGVVRWPERRRNTDTICDYDPAWCEAVDS